ncbi:type II toxin-antitoxin system death-on-curing family toxin [Caulobacter vibrioides]|uniref:Death on curing protein n=2 Tax=Caulobacter vibrioides TaxID=155892 RepID=Q9A343_CAUVC|nr:type II toxin-antitoxin system death-on-curing family toxin [Caulobacter vibrioides]YP_002518846.1 type II toxin-antitoxin system doc family toxin [Caulobacter vibrioides NA1000]AAK25325.1 death on curing protein [Caulobacter vibrioides CB15]ACL96938.1 type II toxin-antitoxin system doc family toxin [Caulobacter vibrioides NA1000]ATC30185.1 type II toxin-antitoxin system death-on-curing family toxin [Caulobacter vibrioides]AZH14375.1 type II toxin-antitoxin system death-on-curing family tox
MSGVGEPVWVRIEALKVLHERSLALHGGPSGVRDEGLLESALERPKNRFHYEGVDDVVELAATYAVAVSSNHPFVDGNKRAAFHAMTLFLRLNGLRLVADQADAARTIFKLAAGELDIPALTDWLRTRVA